ncbi:protein Red-like [Gigaspora margarita]|uniref:Protein Red-like n=1 Tax=Gigaspora margarita TaxID=4874 RepID=A0A8H4AA97_GIGMA|nr:protein Red-like [Gigaspora margarita]
MSDTNTQENKHRGLKQDDFRKLLQTPRPGDASSKGVLGMATPRQRMAPSTPRTFAKPETLGSKPKKNNRYRKPEVSDIDANDTKYRDRAAERRKGANPDYQETEQILKALNNSETLEAKMIYEQSKYLGGDTEHTHLVKGLDYALLAKVRNEITKEEGGGKNDDFILERIKEEMQETPKINSLLARNIYNITMLESKQHIPKVNELFVAGRMAYIFELADEVGGYSDPFAIPTTVIRSKADISDSAGVDKSTNDLVIEKISRVMAYMRKGERAVGGDTKDKKLKKRLREKQPAEVTMVKLAAIDDSEDIFADAGRDYKVMIENDNVVDKKDVTPLPADSSTSTSAEKPKDYFNTNSQEGEGESMEIDKPQENQTLKTLIHQAAAASGVKKIDESLTTELGNDTYKSSKKDDIKKRLFGQDSYEGDYSTYGLGVSSLAGTRESAYDSGHSDSDSDGTGVEHTIRDQGVTKNKKAQLSRWDFDTEEEWQAYKDNVTAMPKSAFQFGVKTGDGRKTRRSGKELTEKQKLDRDWQKISRIMEQKYGNEEGGEEGSSRKKQKK